MEQNRTVKTRIERAGSWSYFLRHFKPLKNDRQLPGSGLDYLFEVDGEDLDTVRQYDHYHIWTLIQDGNSDKLYIFPGIHFANRCNYLLTEAPWTDELDYYLWG